jgi:tetratricopeptide (TPR) repeat protein
VPWRLVVEKLPLFALSAASCVVTSIVQRQAAAQLDVLPLWSRVANAMIAYVTYVVQFFWPVALVPLYPHEGKELPLWQVPAAFAILVGISICVLVWRRKCPYLLVGWCWYLGMLVPVIGLVQVGQQSMADRYTYLPQIGLVIALAWGAKQVLGTWPYRVWLYGATSALAIALLMGCAWRQTHFWCNPEALWSHFLECISNNAVAHSSLGAAYYDQGRTDEAITHYRQAVKINPRYKDAHNNLGVALRGQGHIEEALAQFEEALSIDPRYKEAHLGLALTLGGVGQVPQAIAHYQEALSIDPSDFGAHNSVGVLLNAQGQFDAAIAHFQAAIRIKPDDALAHYNLGTALRDQRRLDEAVVEFQEALRIDPQYVDAHTSLGVVLYWQGYLDEAVVHLQKALELKPDNVMAHVNLGAVYTKQKGKLEAAIAEYEKALAIKPDDLLAHYNLGAVLFNQGRLEDAIAHYRKALEINPQSADAHNSLANALYRKGDIREAASQWRETLRLQPEHIAALNQLAWVLATSPEASVRNGGEAVKLAQRAGKLAGRPDPFLLNTLAAAYAEDGRFAEAVQTARMALEMAAKQKDQNLVESIKARISLYEAKSPYREMP